MDIQVLDPGSEQSYTLLNTCISQYITLDFGFKKCSFFQDI